jgi:hypothetical protein
MARLSAFTSSKVTESLKIGAGVGSVVKGHATIESFASNRSTISWTQGRSLARIACR